MGTAQHAALFEFPARRLTLEMFLPQSKHYTGTHCEDRFLHRQNVILHSFHTELVLALVDRKELPPRGDIGEFRDAFDDDRFVRVFGADHAVVILAQVSRLPRFAAGAEQELSALPKAPDHHAVRGTVWLDRGDPVIVRLLQPLLGPTPSEQSSIAFGQAIAWHEGSAGLRSPAWLRSFLRESHNGSMIP
jgi:hypothetical protein